MLALGTLAAVAIPLAAPGADLVPGSDAGSPGWLLGVYGGGLGIGGGGYLVALWIGFAAYLGVVACASAMGRRVLGWAVAIAILVFALAPPLLSLDVFSYLSYARLGTLHGLNPYDFAPAAIPHDAAAMRVEDYQQATSVYGPLFTLGSYPLGLVGLPGGLWGMKAIAALAVLGLTALVARVAAVRGVAPAPAAALVALNPLVLVDVVGGAHNDALMMLGLVGGVALTLAAREGEAGVALAAAAAIKLPAAVGAPFAVLGARTASRRFRLIAGAAAATVAIAAAGLAVFGTSVVDGLSLLSGSQQHVSYHSLPATVDRGIGVGLDAVRAAFAAGFAVLVVWLLVWTARGGDWVRAAAWAMFALLCATVYLTPWYVLWALPLVAVSRDRVLVVLTLALCAYQLPVGVP